MNKEHIDGWYVEYKKEHDTVTVRSFQIDHNDKENKENGIYYVLTYKIDDGNIGIFDFVKARLVDAKKYVTWQYDVDNYTLAINEKSIDEKWHKKGDGEFYAYVAAVEMLERLVDKSVDFSDQKKPEFYNEHILNKKVSNNHGTSKK